MRKALRLLTSVLLCLQLCSLNQAAETATAPKTLPLEQFTKFDEFGTIKISPDGETLAVTTGKFGRSMLAFINLKDKKINGAIRTRDDVEIGDFHWVSPTRLIYSLAERGSYLTVPIPTGEIYAIDRDSHNQALIYGFRAGSQSTITTRIKLGQTTYASARLISTLPNDDRNILIAENVWQQGVSTYLLDPMSKPIVTLLDVYTGATKRLGTVPLGGANVLIDKNEQVRFAVGLNDKSKLAVSWKPSATDDWQAFSLTGFRDESVIPRLFSKDNQSVYFTGVAEGETFAALYRLDLKAEQIYKVYGFDHADIGALTLDFAGGEIVGVFGHSDVPVHHWLNAEDATAKLYEALYRAFPKQNVSITSSTRDGHLTIVFVQSDTNPGDYYLFDTQTMKAEYLKSARSWIDPEQMRAKESFTLTARDGLQLHGYITKPIGKGPYPLVVMPHGGPHGVRDAADFESDVQLLANRGYAVLQVNFRGSGGYGMDFEAAGYREWGGKMQDDVTDATRWAVDQKIASADRICIFGASYGGFAALMGAVREPGLYACAIGYAGIYDLELMFSSADIPKSKSGRDYLTKVLGNDHQQLRARSPVFNAQQIESPVLLIHGKEDWRADFDQAKRMKAALEKNHKSLEWMALSGEGHGAYDENTRKQVYERVLAFLDKYLPVSAAGK